MTYYLVIWNNEPHKNRPLTFSHTDEFVKGQPVTPFFETKEHAEAFIAQHKWCWKLKIKEVN